MSEGSIHSSFDVFFLLYGDQVAVGVRTSKKPKAIEAMDLKLMKKNVAGGMTCK